MTTPTPNRRQRRAAASTSASPEEKPATPPVAKVYVAYSYEDEEGVICHGWKIISGLTTLRTAAQVGNVIAHIEGESAGKMKNVVLLTWKSLED